MGVAVSTILNLECLRGAKVLGGVEALDNEVSSVTVLEESTLNPRRGEASGQMVITSFSKIKDDTKAQYEVIKALDTEGVVCLCISQNYTKRVEKSLIDLCNRLNMVLLQIPLSSDRYQKIIYEVMQCIYTSQSSHTFLGLILQHMVKEPEHRRSMEAATALMRDLMHLSFMLCDTNANVLNICTWPLEKEQEIRQLGKQGAALVVSTFHASHRALHQDVHFFCFNTDSTLVNPALFEQACEIVELCLDLFSPHYGDFVVSELIKAILNDEPIKMRRLANLFNIDVKSIDTLLLINYQGTAVERRALMLQWRGELEKYFLPVVADIYEDHLIAFINSKSTSKNLSQLALQTASKVFANAASKKYTVYVSTDLKDTSHTLSNYLSIVKYEELVAKIYPKDTLITFAKIALAKQVKHIIENGQVSYSNALSVLQPLEEENPILLDSLETYLLEGQCNIKDTATLMDVHVNTMKYRIHQISLLLGYPPNLLPESLRLYVAVAIRRVLKN